ncbi:type II secretion system protein [Anaerococcus tetradius]|uniref:type II secretion system protein n=1 Tax=Anaerococcus tetradius TaxID=33036 RepID=UPI0023F3AEB6|nr:prepilin-type N-terminal cleavage/methylation domain-containing protein [Anaerococcus tetradius]
MKKKKGFTLIELVIVIAIITVLAAIAIPRYNASKEKAAIAAHNANVQMLTSAANMAVSDGIVGVTWTKEEEAKDYVQKWPQVPKRAGHKNEEYVVKIDKDGKISVETVVVESKDSKDKKEN